MRKNGFFKIITGRLTSAAVLCAFGIGCFGEVGAKLIPEVRVQLRNKIKNENDPLYCQLIYENGLRHEQAEIINENLANMFSRVALLKLIQTAVRGDEEVSKVIFNPLKCLPKNTNLDDDKEPGKTLLWNTIRSAFGLEAVNDKNLKLPDINLIIKNVARLIVEIAKAVEFARLQNIDLKKLSADSTEMPAGINELAKRAWKIVFSGTQLIESSQNPETIGNGDELIATLDLNSINHTRAIVFSFLNLSGSVGKAQQIIKYRAKGDVRINYNRKEETDFHNNTPAHSLFGHIMNKAHIWYPNNGKINDDAKLKYLAWSRAARIDKKDSQNINRSFLVEKRQRFNEYITDIFKDTNWEAQDVYKSMTYKDSICVKLKNKNKSIRMLKTSVSLDQLDTLDQLKIADEIGERPKKGTPEEKIYIDKLTTETTKVLDKIIKINKVQVSVCNVDYIEIAIDPKGIATTLLY